MVRVHQDSKEGLNASLVPFLFSALNLFFYFKANKIVYTISGIYEALRFVKGAVPLPLATVLRGQGARATIFNRLVTQRMAVAPHSLRYRTLRLRKSFKTCL